MRIIPAIDIKNGKCVRLYQGDYGRETIYDDNPVIVAQKWEKQGAQMLHIVDLDGAKMGRMINSEIIQKIIETVNIPIQVGGGIRSYASIEELIRRGIKRIILGTAALDDNELLNRALSSYGERIIISLDANKGILMKNGWLEKSRSKVLPTVSAIEKKGIRSIIYTDTTKDGTLTEPNYKIIQSIIQRTSMDVFVAGGISSIDQLLRLKEMNVKGVIIGKAIYEGKINLKEVIALC